MDEFDRQALLEALAFAFVVLLIVSLFVLLIMTGIQQRLDMASIRDDVKVMREHVEESADGKP